MAGMSGTYCLNHPDTPAVARCATCGKHICAQCVVTKNGAKYCSEACAQAAANSNLKCNAAFALALIGDKTAVPELLRLVLARDEYAPSTSFKYNHKRGYAAVYLLGRIAAKDAIPALLDIIGDIDMQDKYEYHGHAIAALVKIADANPETKDEIYSALAALANNKNWHLEACLKETKKYVPMDPILREFINKLVQ